MQMSRSNPKSDTHKSLIWKKDLYGRYMTVGKVRERKVPGLSSDLITLLSCMNSRQSIDKGASLMYEENGEYATGIMECWSFELMCIIYHLYLYGVCKLIEQLFNYSERDVWARSKQQRTAANSSVGVSSGCQRQRSWMNKIDFQ